MSFRFAVLYCSAALATAVLPIAARAVPQSGDILDVTATSPSDAGTFSTIFTSPVTVGLGVTDTATFVDEFGQVWSLTLGFTATGFTVDFSEADPRANIEALAGVVDIVLNDLTRPIGSIVRTGYSCVPCAVIMLGPSDTVSVTDNSASLLYTALLNQETYTYAAAAVAEPASLWLLAGGLLGIIAVRQSLRARLSVGAR
jgi:hypothetical protein